MDFKESSNSSQLQVVKNDEANSTTYKSYQDKSIKIKTRSGLPSVTQYLSLRRRNQMHLRIYFNLLEDQCDDHEYMSIHSKELIC